MIKILVDSASDCRKEDNVYDYFVPLTINFDGTEYRGGIDIDSDTFYEKLLQTKSFPRTSQPSPQDFLEIFEEIKESGDELICFTISSELSGTYQGAMMAKNIVEYDGIYVIDSRTATHMIGLMAQYARKLIADGLKAAEIVEKCEALKSRVKVFAGVDTLEYLFRGGRMSRATAAVGELASIKPVLTVTAEGKVEAVKKCLGRSRATQFIVDQVTAMELDETFPVYSVYTYNIENCEQLEKKLESKGVAVAGRRQIGSTIGTHTGPGVYGVMFVVK
ncbi:MAG: DegV family protein [Firmicutes bacterium]|nr:DegV family protein [Bacillota bacterium]